MGSKLVLSRGARVVCRRRWRRSTKCSHAICSLRRRCEKGKRLRPRESAGCVRKKYAKHTSDGARKGCFMLGSRALLGKQGDSTLCTRQGVESEKKGSGLGPPVACACQQQMAGAAAGCETVRTHLSLRGAPLTCVNYSGNTDR